MIVDTEALRNNVRDFYESREKLVASEPSDRIAFVMLSRIERLSAEDEETLDHFDELADRLSNVEPKSMYAAAPQLLEALKRIHGLVGLPQNQIASDALAIAREAVEKWGYR
jgi:hypothetical protein